MYVLIKGTASDVLGIDSETVFRKTVNESSIVTSEICFVSFIQKIGLRYRLDYLLPNKVKLFGE